MRSIVTVQPMGQQQSGYGGRQNERGQGDDNKVRRPTNSFSLRVLLPEEGEAQVRGAYPHSHRKEEEGIKGTGHCQQAACRLVMNATSLTCLSLHSHSSCSLPSEAAQDGAHQGLPAHGAGVHPEPGAPQAARGAPGGRAREGMHSNRAVTVARLCQVDDLRGTPMAVGSLEEIIDDQHAIVRLRSEQEGVA